MNALGDFLRARRAATRPGDVGMPSGGVRRVPGLRRDEVAVLAGMSTDYYVRLEQGRERNPSPEVLTALGRAFRLDGDALAHLRRLAATRHPPRDTDHVSAGTRRLLDLWRDTPALVQNRCADVLAYNRLAGAIHPSLARDRNLLRSFFLDPAERALFPRWEESARIAVAWLRAEADPDSARLTTLVGELALKSPDFARLWAHHDVRVKATGQKTFRHPVVGDFAVDYETFRLEDGTGHTLTVYHAAPGSPDADALALLSMHGPEVVAEQGPQPAQGSGVTHLHR
ncbi:helix-turn-helix transcriptional regulator [Actinoplanes couchii]|uniref:Transcriptional regulator n=1 Tax=Actinoplanes couchii TaxID=403638 RepID=A0ABQ3XLK0_9ACTN|nr:helix-turn-helix transcriptional regulator [Actinoplanes couchii]MDR6318352.1 transcriptional regulator with XRE-family HTH domain [Actinoplanes couchii]GID59280.1 transcriptional regulator [Actinoplanes couchii]